MTLGKRRRQHFPKLSPDSASSLSSPNVHWACTKCQARSLGLWLHRLMKQVSPCFLGAHCLWNPQQGLFRGPGIPHTHRHTHSHTHTKCIRDTWDSLTTQDLTLSNYTLNSELAVSWLTLVRLLHVSCPMSSKQKATVYRCCKDLWIVPLQRSKWTLLQSRVFEQQKCLGKRKDKLIPLSDFPSQNTCNRFSRI